MAQHGTFGGIYNIQREGGNKQDVAAAIGVDADRITGINELMQLLLVGMALKADSNGILKARRGG